MISKDKWISLIKDFHEKKLPVLTDRDINIPLERPIKRAITIIGPRRAGKTYEMYSLIIKITKKCNKEQILYLNFERADLGNLDSSDLVRMLESFYELYPENKKRKIWLFLDEIQMVEGWERFVRTALDDDIEVYISGSSSKLLSSEIATSMRGRSLSYRILPFSFNEYLRIKNIQIEQYLSSTKIAEIQNALRRYMEFGGYPEAVIYEAEKEKILTDILDTVIYKDVIERAKIRNVIALKALINAFINSKEFSTHKFFNFLKSKGMKVGKNLLYEYAQHLNDAFFVFLLRKFSYSNKEKEQSIPKVYIIDNGLLRIHGIEDKGRLMENLVYIQLYRNELDIYYWKSINNNEVDFVVKDGKKVTQLIQVCYNLDNYITKERELKALIMASNELKCNNLLIITWDFEKEEKIEKKNVKYIPLWKWLLE